MTTSPIQPRSSFKRYAVIASVGALAGFVVFCLLGPGALGWWYTPPALEAFSCGPSVAHALVEFVRWQLWAAVGGAVGLLVLAALAKSLWGKITRKNEPPAAIETAPPPVAPVSPPVAPLPPPGGQPPPV